MDIRHHYACIEKWSETDAIEGRKERGMMVLLCNTSLFMIENDLLERSLKKLVQKRIFGRRCRAPNDCMVSHVSALRVITVRLRVKLC
jgi:hypothetical protein